MAIKSNIGLASQNSQQLKSLFNSIGSMDIKCGGTTNLPAIGKVVSLLASNNKEYKRYKHTLEIAATQVYGIGEDFKAFDENAIR